MAFGSIVQDILIRIRASFKNAEEMKKANMSFVEQLNYYKRQIKSSQEMTKMRLKEAATYKAFRFELLSTMFFGQMLQQTMFGLLQPAFQTAGIFDIISTILEVFFLPIALALLDPLLALMDWFLSMPEGVQLVIGAIVLFLGILGGILFFVSQVGLLLGSFGLTFTSLGELIVSAFGIIISIISGALAVLVEVFGGWAIAIVAIIVALVLALIFNWQGFVDAFLNLGKNLVEGVVMFFTGMWDSIMSLAEIFFGLFEALTTGNWDRFNKGVQAYVDGIIKMFTGFFQMTIGAWFQFAVDIGTAFVKGISMAGGWIYDAIKAIPIIGPLIAGGVDFVGGVAGGVADAVGSWWHGLTGLATGGIVTQPTLAMVGEKGPEAVIPLNSTQTMGNTITYAPVYNISNQLDSNVDVDYMLDEIEKRQANDYERLRKL